MRERTLFYSLDLAGVGTPDVESMDSYLCRLAHEHCLRPKDLIETLIAAYQCEGISPGQRGRHLNHSKLNGHTRFGQQILNTLEQATGKSLGASALSHLSSLFPGMHFANKCAPHYCPKCVQEESEHSHGRLLWQLNCVQACPRHRVRLRPTDECGAQAQKALPSKHRPWLPGVCPTCGTVGFRCFENDPQTATDDEVWVAEQMGRVVAQSHQPSVPWTEDSLRQGIAALVSARFDGSVVKASLTSGLSRASVCEWLGKRARPNLSSLVQLAYQAEADIVSLLDGRYLLSPTSGAKGKAVQLTNRQYRRSKTNLEEARIALIAACDAYPPPPISEVAKLLGINRRTMRTKLPQECTALAERYAEYRAAELESNYAQAVDFFSKCAQALTDKGVAVTWKTLQGESNLVVYTRGTTLRTRAFREALRRFQEKCPVENDRNFAKNPASHDAVCTVPLSTCQP
ncbi:MAG: TniQ family protein [Burkholderiales bacterium]|nr:TniQ family protein [Burkholderiales bacterium]